MSAILELNTGQRFTGKSFGKEISQEVFSEIVFQTGMVGYPESLTDPSYLNQILVLTYPLIGNYGIGEPEYDENSIDKFFESNNIHIRALIVGEYNPKYSHWKGKTSLGDWLKEKNIIGISGVDTRELVKIIRENQDVIAKITNQDLSNTEKSLQNVTIEDLNKEICSKDVFFRLNNQENSGEKIILNENPNLLNILVIDCGIKNSRLEPY